MEILLRNIPNDYQRKKHYLDKHSHQIETLILGNSHSLYGLNPDYFSTKTFNASHITQTLYYDFEILKKYQEKLTNLKTVVLSISYFTLFSKLEVDPEYWRVKNYVIYYGLNSSKPLTDHFEVLGNRFDVNISRLIDFYIKGNPAILTTTSGWGTNYNSINAQDLIQTGSSAAKRHTKDDLYSDQCQEIFSENVGILNAIIRWANENDVTVLLFTPPAFESYRKRLNSEQLTTTIETTTEICSQYDNCIYRNFLDDPSFVPEDFYDADHMSEIGAEKLSKLTNIGIDR